MDVHWVRERCSEVPGCTVGYISIAAEYCVFVLLTVEGGIRNQTVPILWVLSHNGRLSGLTPKLWERVVPLANTLFLPQQRAHLALPPGQVRDGAG